MQEGVEDQKVCTDVRPGVLAELLLRVLRTRALRLRNTSDSMRDCRPLTDLCSNGVAAPGPSGAARPPSPEARAPA